MARRFGTRVVSTQQTSDVEPTAIANAVIAFVMVSLTWRAGRRLIVRRKKRLRQ